jgi:hypothetical protein
MRLAVESGWAAYSNPTSALGECSSGRCNISLGGVWNHATLYDFIAEPVRQQRLAQMIVLQCFRNSFLEDLHGASRRARLPVTTRMLWSTARMVRSPGQRSRGSTTKR